MVFCAAAVAAVTALASPARAQSSASEFSTQVGVQVTASIRTNDLQQTDLPRRFGHALVDDGRDLILNPGASMDEVRRTLLRRAAVYEDVQEYANAEAELTKALQRTPPIGDTYAARGYFYMRRGRFADAVGDFVAGMQIDPNNPRLHFSAGRAESALGDYAAAVTYYGEAIKLAPREPTYYLARAEADIHLDQPAGAHSDYDRAIAMRLARPTDRYFAFLGRGYASLMQADYTGAIADFGTAIEINPGSINALMWRGYARERSGQITLALDDYERAAAVDPHDRLARDNLQRLRSN
ncbi:MAG TPA: tetratricopeptide repeat protein [Xanthobacteraceae bacterium]|nr:tetratricopeptide repeat protein [Xanthobacteraceae bacterium]